MFVAKCKGEGHSSCRNCEKEGRYSRTWTCFLYRIKGLEGMYCWKCIKECSDTLKEAIIIVDDF